MTILKEFYYIKIIKEIPIYNRPESQLIFVVLKQDFFI